MPGTGNILQKFFGLFKAAVLVLIIIACNNISEKNISSFDSNDEGIVAQNTDVHKSKQLSNTPDNKSVPIKGKVIMLDTMPPPKVVPAGKPRIVPLKDNTAQAGIAEVIKIPKKLTIVVQGKDSIPLPEVYNVQIDTLKMSYPEPALALLPRFKDESNYNIRYLNIDQDFGRLIPFKIIQDKRKNIWIATNIGIIKYDGTFISQILSFTKYIKEDSKGIIWFATSGGIINFDGNTFKAYTVKCDTGRIPFRYVSSILEDKNGNLWFASDSSFGVYKYEPGSLGKPNGRFIHYSENEGLVSNTINCITEDKEGNIWFGSNGSGLCKYEATSNGYPNGRFIHYSSSEGLSNNIVTSIIEDRNGILWIGTYGGGVNIFDGKYFTHLTEKEGLCSNLIYSIHEDKNGVLWFATSGGGVCMYKKNVYGTATGIFTYLTREDYLISNYIQSIMGDDNGNIWFDSDEGVMIYNPRSFTHITANMGIEIDFLTSPCEDKDGNIWFGEVLGGGICKFDGESFNYFSRKDGLCGDSVTSVISDKTGNIWIGTSGGGVCKYDGEYFTHFTKKNGLSSNLISCLLEDKNGNIWIGTKKGGVCRYDGNSFTQFTRDEGLCDNFIWDILEDRKGNLWFGTKRGGADKYDGKYITNFCVEDGLSGNEIISLIEDKRGDIWFGIYGGGVTRYDPDSPDASSRFVQFLHQGGNPLNKSSIYFNVLSNPFTKFLVEDNSGNIWIGTEEGTNLLILPENGALNDMQVEILTTQDGLKGDNPVENSVYIDSKNRLYVGYYRTLSVLDLNTFEIPTKPPSIQLKNIELEQSFIDYRALLDSNFNNKQLFIGANKDINLKKVRFTGVAPFYNYPLNLKLPYRFNHFTFFYSAIDWSAPHKIQYQYKLEGSDRDWRQITKETKAIYTNLTHGNYTFKVKAIGAAQKWSDTFEYSFIIRPPWWLTWWAYTIYGLIILLLIYAWRRYDLKRQHLKHDLELEHVQTEKLEELDKMKSRFFANISHEFRTPLTLILGPLQNLISKTTDKDSKQELDIMQRNARRLQKLINQLLNLSRIEAGKMKLQAREENIVSLTRLFVQSFESYAAQRKISLVFTAKEEQIPVYVDRDKIEKILSNLLSNAFKFTGEGGRIEVAVGSPQSAVGSPQSAVGSPQSAVGSKATEDWRLFQHGGEHFHLRHRCRYFIQTPQTHFRPLLPGRRYLLKRPGRKWYRPGFDQRTG